MEPGRARAGQPLSSRSVAALPDSLPDTALARLFADDARAGAAAWFSLPGGAVLCEAGEPADQLFFLRTGRLAAVRHEEGQEAELLGVIRPGEPAGEMALIAGTPHTAKVVALRDSEVLALPRAAFLAAAQADAGLMTELARLMILRLRQEAGTASVGEPSVFGFAPLCGGIDLRDLVEQLARSMRRQGGYAVEVVGVEALHAPTEWFSAVEQAHDFVLYVAELEEVAWRAIVARQVDRLFRVGRGDEPPPADIRIDAPPLHDQGLVDLVLLQPASAAAPQGTEAWIEAAKPARWFHLRQGDGGHIDRLARLLTGQSVGLVLSGGGARAYAHVGALRALHERHVPIDFVGGVSMGAIVAGGLAMGWTQEELETRLRKAFVDSSPTDDIAFPLIAMTQGLKVRERLHEHFGERQMADLWLPFFCLSSNLTTGAYQLHRRGVLSEALRASIALPGVLPPAIDGQNVLVDGAVMKNFPTDVMRAMHLGPIVGVDVTRGRALAAEDVRRPASLWRWILSGEWRKGPPIVGLLMRAATVASGRDHVASREAADVLVTPDVDRIDMRDWRAFEPAVQAGYAATVRALDALDDPIPMLRARQPLSEMAPTLGLNGI